MKNATITKVVIPAAGLGTRFLPATKSVPKELLPIVDTPTIQYIVEEAVQSGIETVIFITGRGKAALEDHFDLYPALEEKLEKDGKIDLLHKLRQASLKVRAVSIRQRRPLGLGHAVLCSKSVVGNEPFVVMLGDDLVDSQVPCVRQLMDVYEKHGKSVVALQEVPQQEVEKFGIASGEDLGDRVLRLNAIVEKPSPEKAPSNLACVGRYVLTPAIFKHLENTTPGLGGEIQLTDAMASLMEEEGFLGYKFEGTRYDAGDKLGFLKANIAYALKREDIRGPLLEYIKGIIKA